MKVRLPQKLTAQQAEAMNKEIYRQIAEDEKRFSLDYDSTVLWTLHICFGFGKKRLRKFWETFFSERERLRDIYEMGPSDSGWLCRNKLKDIGVDVEEWYKERRY